MRNWIEIGEHNRPEVVTVNLLEDEEAVNLTKKSEKTDWDYLFINLEEYNDLLKEHNKKMDEVALPPKYDEAVFSNYNPSDVEVETEISGRKIWFDDKSQERPKSIILYLFANEEVVARQVISNQGDWRYRFTNIPLYDEAGELIDYHVEEREIKGYETSYDGWTVINRRSERTEGKITKKWKPSEEESLPESIQVSLLRNGEKLEEIKLSGAEDWQCRLTDLELFDEEGKAYEYTIEEKFQIQGKKAKIKLGDQLDEKDIDIGDVGKVGIGLATGTLILLGLASKLRRKN